jgi:hypothetical protein
MLGFTPCLILIAEEAQCTETEDAPAKCNEMYLSRQGHPLPKQMSLLSVGEMTGQISGTKKGTHVPVGNEHVCLFALKTNDINRG